MKTAGAVAFLCAMVLAACGGGEAAREASPTAAARPVAQAQQAEVDPTAALRVWRAFKGRQPTAAEFAAFVSRDPAVLGANLAAGVASLSDATLSATLLANLGVTVQTTNPTSVSILQQALAQYFGAYGPAARGQIAANLVGLLAGLAADGTWGVAAQAFNRAVAADMAAVTVCTPCEAAGAAVNPGGSTAASLSASVQAVRHATTLTGGTTYTIAVTSSIAQLTLEIRNAANALVASLSVTDGMRIPFTPPASGAYSIVMRTSGTAGGGYSLGVANAPMKDSFGRDVDLSFAGGGDDASGVDGTAGDGAPIPNARVTVRDSTGRTSVATTDSSGYYRADTTGMVAPLVVSVLRADGFEWRSPAVAAVTRRKFQTANITGLTDKVASDLATAAGLANGSASVTPQVLAANSSRLAQVKSNLNTGLYSKLYTSGLDPASFDAVTSAFRAVLTDPHDRLLESVQPVRDPRAGNTNIVLTLAGSPNQQRGFVDGLGPAARLTLPGVAVHSDGNVFVVDTYNHAVRRVSREGQVTTLAGGGPSAPGFADGSGTAARFREPHQLVLDAAGNMYVTDWANSAIRKVSPSGTVTTLAGAGTAGFRDGTGSDALFNGGEGIAIDSAGNLYVADMANHRIRKVTPAGVVITFAGSGNQGTVDGLGTGASFDLPCGVAVDRNGTVWVAEYGGSTIRRISPSGQVTTVAGRAQSTGWVDGTGTAARFYAPTGLAVDTNGNLYVADFGNLVIRRVNTATFAVTTVAGSGEYGLVDGRGTAARFSYPATVAVDTAGRIFVGDNWNFAVRLILP